MNTQLANIIVLISVASAVCALGILAYLLWLSGSRPGRYKKGRLSNKARQPLPEGYPLYSKEYQAMNEARKGEPGALNTLEIPINEETARLHIIHDDPADQSGERTDELPDGAFIIDNPIVASEGTPNPPVTKENVAQAVDAMLEDGAFIIDDPIKEDFDSTEARRRLREFISSPDLCSGRELDLNDAPVAWLSHWRLATAEEIKALSETQRETGSSLPDGYRADYDPETMEIRIHKLIKKVPQYLKPGDTGIAGLTGPFKPRIVDPES